MPNRTINKRFQATIELKNILDHSKNINLGNEDAFYKTLLGISLRRLGQIDLCLKEYIKKPIKKNKSIIKANIIIGAAQILFMNTPNYAAVNDAVKIAKIISPNHVNFTNAILRNLSRDKENEKIKEMDPINNIPSLLKKKWLKLFNNEQLKKISLQHIIMPPALDITFKNLKDVDKYVKQLNGIKLGKNNIRILNPKGKISNYSGYKKGKWWVQDIAAQIPCKILINSVSKNAKVIDLCAAPGGKTAQLISYGVEVTAVEKNLKRTRILSNNLKRLGLKAKIVNKDANSWKPKTLADAVLIDAPCSSTGTIRKNPDIPWRLNSSEEAFNSKIKLLNKEQDKLLISGSKMIDINGILIYSVCSLEPEEGKNLIKNFINKNTEFKIIPIRPNEIDIPNKAITQEGFIQTFPFLYSSKGGMDGFFIARLMKSH